jgi:hypothetical protein
MANILLIITTTLAAIVTPPKPPEVLPTPEPVVSSPAPAPTQTDVVPGGVQTSRAASPGTASWYPSISRGTGRSAPGPGQPTGHDSRERPALPLSGLASWYGERPDSCDGLPLPWWVTTWTASLTLPCGSKVTVIGPAGAVTIPVWDRGPEAWTGRIFDLTPDAFRSVAGSLSVGVVPVEWRPAA